MHPDFRETARKRALARQPDEGVPTRYGFKLRRKDGEVRWVEFTIVETASATGRFHQMGVIGIVATTTVQGPIGPARSLSN
ncbi:MAG: PAS domain S-box protein [Planctomycetes bacterium]|nr:PAS domain S-box protein [Planctomycetota bacterium]